MTPSTSGPVRCPFSRATTAVALQQLASVVLLMLASEATLAAYGDTVGQRQPVWILPEDSPSSAAGAVLGADSVSGGGAAPMSTLHPRRLMQIGAGAGPQ